MEKGRSRYDRPVYGTQSDVILALIVAVHLFHFFVQVLRFEGHRGNRPGVKTLEADRLASDFTIEIAWLGT